MISSAIVPCLFPTHVCDCLIRLTINHSIAEMAVAISAAAVFPYSEKCAAAVGRVCPLAARSCKANLLAKQLL